MQSLEDREALARTVLAAADRVAQMTERADIWAVVPVKDTAAAKQRLAPALPADLRQGLALAMLEDVLAALAEARGLAGRCWSRSIPAARDLAARYGAQCVADGARDGHTGAVIGGGASSRGRRARRDADPARRHPARHRRRDRAADRRRICRRPRFTIAPSHDEMGSNAILMSPPDAVPLRFGDDSFRPHLAAARAPASSRRSCACPASHWISTTRPISRIFGNSDRARERACGSREHAGALASADCRRRRERSLRRDAVPPLAGSLPV